MFRQVHRGDSAADFDISIPHLNIEQGVLHFPKCTATDQTCTFGPSHEDTTEVCQQQTVANLLEQGFSATMVRDFPLGTLEDFVEEGHSLHSIHPEVYERRICLLALQLVQGLQQLGHFNVTSRDLKPQCVNLVWPSMKRKDANACEYATDLKIGGNMNKDSIEQIEEKKKSEICQTLWEDWGTPRLVLKSHFEDDVFQEATSQEFQLGTLLKYSLHLDDNSSSEIRVKKDTPYTSGLLWLVTQLTSEKPELLLADVAAVLQVLLWGPRQGLFMQNQPENSVFHNWQLLKRSLLVLKLAEKGLFQDQHGFDWEDYLCLHYLSFSDPETLRSITERIGLH